MLIVNCIIPSQLNEESYLLLEECFVSLFKASNLAKNIKLNLVLVSTNDLNHKKLKGYDFQYLKAAEQSGFGELNNLAINKYLKSDNSYFLLINDDATVAEDFFIIFEKLIRRNRSDIYIPLIKEFDKNAIDSFGVEYFKSAYAKNIIDEKVSGKLFSATVVLISSQFLLRLKHEYSWIFNPIFFYYLEDVDLAIRSFMIGVDIFKAKDLRAFHRGSSTSGKKSYFSIYHTYRNLTWIIIMDWPIQIILRNLFNIFLVQGWMFIYGVTNYGIKMYFKILKDLIVNFPNLLKIRKKVLSSYDSNNDFKKIFSKYSFRTYHDKKIPAL